LVLLAGLACVVLGLACVQENWLFALLFAVEAAVAAVDGIDLFYL